MNSSVPREVLVDIAAEKMRTVEGTDKICEYAEEYLTTCIGNFGHNTTSTIDDVLRMLLQRLEAESWHPRRREQYEKLSTLYKQALEKRESFLGKNNECRHLRTPSGVCSSCGDK